MDSYDTRICDDWWLIDVTHTGHNAVFSQLLYKIATVQKFDVEVENKSFLFFPFRTIPSLVGTFAGAQFANVRAPWI